MFVGEHDQKRKARRATEAEIVFLRTAQERSKNKKQGREGVKSRGIPSCGVTRNLLQRR